MMGMRFIAVAMARTRLLSDSGNRQRHNTPHEDRKYTLNIAKRRPHVNRLNTKNIVNDFFGPAKFSDDLFIRQSSKCIMAPGVNSNLVAAQVFLLKKGRPTSDSGTHDEESRLEVHLVQIIEEVRSVRSGTIIICETPLIFLGASGDIS
jgi:hypothetical protein